MGSSEVETFQTKSINRGPVLKVKVVSWHFPHGEVRLRSLLLKGDQSIGASVVAKQT